MLKGNLIQKTQKRIQKIETTNLPEDIKQIKKENYQKRIKTLKHYRRTITLWEKRNNNWFNGTEADVYTYKDLQDHCNEMNNEYEVIVLINEGIYTPIGGNALTPYDLRNYIYLPTSLIEKDENYTQLKKALHNTTYNGEEELNCL
jgi:hypothetical protein